ncbi:DUF5710 domain-containing protein [Streptomyces sp. NPDC102278]|uniref:DUF5710 domain-containing protein n=1 Tax=Streptomyces sp. NPDC102278 TaxID=3366152 RepID=UPI00380569C1
MVERIWLDVPYAEKDQAEAAGARWDPAAKRWYAPRKGMTALEPWTAAPDVPDLLPGEDRTLGDALIVDLVPSSPGRRGGPGQRVPRRAGRPRSPGAGPRPASAGALRRRPVGSCSVRHQFCPRQAPRVRPRSRAVGPPGRDRRRRVPGS